MRFRLTITATFEADTGNDALLVRRDSHYAFEDALVDRLAYDDNPGPDMERFNHLNGKIEGLDEESQEALREALLETEGPS